MEISVCCDKLLTKNVITDCRTEDGWRRYGCDDVSTRLVLVVNLITFLLFKVSKTYIFLIILLCCTPKGENGTHARTRNPCFHLIIATKILLLLYILTSLRKWLRNYDRLTRWMYSFCLVVLAVVHSSICCTRAPN